MIADEPTRYYHPSHGYGASSAAFAIVGVACNTFPRVEGVTVLTTARARSEAELAVLTENLEAARSS